MSEKPRVVDGADRRKQRLLELLMFVVNNDGATSQEIKAFMTIRFGLQWNTTAKYIQELHLSGLLALMGAVETGKWRITAKYKKLAKYLYG